MLDFFGSFTDFLSGVGRFLEPVVEFFGGGKSLLAAGVAAYGTSQAAKAFEFEKDFARRATERNLDILWFNEAVRKTELEEYTLATLGAQKAAAAAAGVNPIAGSPLEVQAETVFRAQRAAALLEQAALLEAEKIRTQGELTGRRASSQKRLTLLEGASRVAKSLGVF